MNQNSINLIPDLVLIKYAHTQLLADKLFNFFLWNRRRVFAELLPMLHTAGTAPDNLPRWAGNAPVVMIAFSTNQKATQYILGIVPGGLSLLGIFVDVAAFALFSLCQEEVIKADDIADILLIREQIAEYWLCPMRFSLG